MPVPKRTCLPILVSSIFYLIAMPEALALTCGGKLITEGDSKLTVKNLCGKPDWIDRWFEETIEQPDTDFEHSITKTNERWIYNPGPNQFIQIVNFRGSEVLSIKTGGYGFLEKDQGQRCNFNTLSLGISSGEVTIECGEPDLRNTDYETITSKTESGRLKRSVTVDEWTYNLGPSRFMRILTFRNGELIDIRTGEKGFK